MKRQLYLCAGLLAVALGTIGIFLPLLPTVPFMILAAFCFARSSPALEARLLNHPRYGHHLVAWREKGAISRRGKWSATAAFGLSIAIGFAALTLPWSLVPVGVAVLCLGWIWFKPET
ncbi:YbaN family protein [Sphingorhabdus sp.]|uniref:YbaN family protein n=1 Tax=Sphingorhabdus sp. TaxID=1902408 RepID=UPI003918C40A